MEDERRTLCAEVADAAAFRGIWHAQLSKGGLFVAGTTDVELRESVRVELALGWCGRTLELGGEVVALLSAEMAGVAGEPGAAVHFERSPRELRELFGDLLSEEPDGEPSPPPDRRKAPREPARLRVRVRGDSAEVDGRTRDLSRSGLLVSHEGEEAPAVGERVELDVLDPREGHAHHFVARVARHVSDEDGEVTAFAVAFEPAADDAHETTQILEGLGALEHSRGLAVRRGSLTDVSLGALVTQVASTSPVATLSVMQRSLDGFVALEHGQLRAARLGGVAGIKALSRMLAWRDGRFEVAARVDPAEPRDEPVTIEVALARARSQLEELEAPGIVRFPRGARLRVMPERGDPGADKLHAALLDLARAGSSVGRALDVIPVSDARVLVALGELVGLGWVEVRGGRL